MSKNLCNKVGEIGQDNLIAKLFPPAETFGVKIPAGTGKLERGTVLALAADGTYCVFGNSKEIVSGEGENAVTTSYVPEANCVLADPVDASGEEDVVGVAYRTGHLNRKALIVAEGYKMTMGDEEDLRKCGILLSDMAL